MLNRLNDVSSVQCLATPKHFTSFIKCYQYLNLWKNIRLSERLCDVCKECYRSITELDWRIGKLCWLQIISLILFLMLHAICQWLLMKTREDIACLIIFWYYKYFWMIVSKRSEERTWNILFRVKKNILHIFILCVKVIAIKFLSSQNMKKNNITIYKISSCLRSYLLINTVSSSVQSVSIH